MSPLFVSAVVRSEDMGFLEHRGIDWRATLRMAIVTAARRRIVGGASTITQQLARNLYLTPARSMARKLREMWLASRIERTISKARILELYLNVVEWGRGVWGCAAATEYYFHRAPRDLGLFESTLLAVLLPAPRAGLTGRDANRSQGKQLWLAYQLTLAGMADPEECAVCCERIRELHRLLARGVPIQEAVAGALRVCDSPDAVFLRELVNALGVIRTPVSRVWGSLCSREQECLALERLRERFGLAVVQQVFATGRLDVLREAVAASRPTLS